MRGVLQGVGVALTVVAGAGVAGCGGASPPAEGATNGLTSRSADAELPGAGHCERRAAAPRVRPLPSARQGGSAALARDGARLLAYAADEDAHALHTVDVEAGSVLATTQLSGAPSQVLVLADGRVAVTLRNKNRLQLLEPGSDAGQPLDGLCSVKTPVEPVALAVTPDQRTLVVTTAWARRLSAFEGRTLEHRFSVELAREPRDVLVDDDGSRAFVAHVVGGALSVVELAEPAHEVRTVDLRVPRTHVTSGADKTRESCQGFALAKTLDVELAAHAPPLTPRGRIFVPRVTIEPGDPTQRTAGYGGGASQGVVEHPIVSVVDAAAERNLTAALMEPRSRTPAAPGGCLLPRAARVSPHGGGLLVACAGTNVLLELDPRGTDPARLERRRWTVPAGPTGVAVDDIRATAVVWSQFDRQLAVIDLKAKGAEAVSFVTPPLLAKKPMSELALWGRRLFHQTDDPRISRDGRACASCHPDGREDALTWSTPVGPRQTIMLAGRVQASAPYSWLGAHDDVATHLTATFQRLGGTGLQRRDDGQGELDALIAYVETMPGPTLEDALELADATLVARGKALFFANDIGCASCHVGGAGTDKTTHDVHGKVADMPSDKFDTPSLRFVGGTAPYFHDGRYASLLALLTASDTTMGHTLHLPHRDIKALAAFLETL